METSEELRLQHINFLNSLIGKSNEGDLFPFLSDITNVLQKTIIDKCPEVKKVFR